ncbi:hypothetical protein QE152_g6760 [Popillia japonica]|uniref:Uncharacterized protein n=1 Tax=Popillia japonica TaxID=7064 RepID=A0AAW1MHE1_POPJA
MYKLTVVVLLCVAGLNAIGIKDLPNGILIGSSIADVRPSPTPEEEAAPPCLIDEDFLQPWPPAPEVDDIILAPEEEACEDEANEGILVLPEVFPVPETFPIVVDPVAPLPLHPDIALPMEIVD